MYFIQLTLLVIRTLIALLTRKGEKTYRLVLELQRKISHLKKERFSHRFGEMLYLDNHNDKSSTALVLLHGFGAEMDHWGPFAKALGKNYRIIIPNLTAPVENKNFDYSLQSQARRLHELLTMLHLDKVNLIGNSMGGGIALKYSFEYASSVNSLSLMDSMGLETVQSDFGVLLKEGKRNPMLNICSAKEFKALLSFSMQKPSYAPNFLFSYLAKEKCARVALDTKIFEAILSDMDLSAIITQISIPTLIIWGKKDRIFHVDNAEAFHQMIKGSQVLILDDVGHVPLMEAPKASARSYRDFIQSLKD